MKRFCRVSYLTILPSEIPVKGPLPKRSKATEKGPTEVDGKSIFWKFIIGWEKTEGTRKRKKIMEVMIVTNLFNAKQTMILLIGITTTYI